LFAFDESGFEQHFQVMADGWLGELERLGEVADAGFAGWLGLDQAEQPEASRVGDHFQRLGEAGCFGGVEWPGKKWWAGPRECRDRLHDRILTEVDVLVTLPDIDRRRYQGSVMSQALDPVTQHHVQQAADRLKTEFAGIFSVETIERYIGESLDLLGSSRINVFVPVLAHRFARERLKALAQAEHLIATDQPEVLFVCVHNAGRSQMAAGLVKLRSNGRIHVRSAGSAPGGEINPAVIDAMEELGVDMAEEFPKPLADEFVQAADVVITMGCGDACPIYPGKKYEDWELDDPAGQDLDAVRTIRNQIDEHVQRLIADLLPTE
jgi:arsenate reductase